MLVLIKVIYGAFLMPPGIYIIALLLAACWIYRRDRVAGRVILVLTCCIYLVSTGFLARAVVHSLQCQYSPPEEIHGDVIVMLGGGAIADAPNVNEAGTLSGHAANRLLTTVQLYHKLGVPILVSGGQVMKGDGLEADIAKRIMLDMGVPADKIITETASRNTTENAQECAVVLVQHRFKEPILVTSAFHMRRAVLQFEKAGITVTPFPCDYLIGGGTGMLDYFPLPQNSWLLGVGLKEYLGIAAVKWY